jgi:hypothetical protein
MNNALIQGIYDSAVAEWMRTTLKAMPIVEGIHLLSTAALFGTILIVDLRLLGIPDSRRPFTQVARDVLPWTWLAFAVNAITGTLMFAQDAVVYASDTTFLLKMAALPLAGINMLVFELVTRRSAARWDQNARPPRMARAAAIISLSLWMAMIVLGRWTGYTKGRDFTMPEGPQPQFEFAGEAD